MQAHTDHTKLILESVKRDKELATEIYSELYIYTHYTQEQVGIDYQAFTYQYHNKKTDNTWLENLIYRLSSIFRRRGLHISIDVEDINDMISFEEEFGLQFC